MLPDLWRVKLLSIPAVVAEGNQIKLRGCKPRKAKRAKSENEGDAPEGEPPSEGDPPSGALATTGALPARRSIPVHR